MPAAQKNVMTAARDPSQFFFLMTREVSLQFKRTTTNSGKDYHQIRAARDTTIPNKLPATSRHNGAHPAAATAINN